MSNQKFTDIISLLNSKGYNVMRIDGDTVEFVDVDSEGMNTITIYARWGLTLGQIDKYIKDRNEK